MDRMNGDPRGVRKAGLVMLILLLAALMLASGPGHAQPAQSSARYSACDDNRLPGSLRARIVLESRGDGGNGVLSDSGLASAEEGRALRDWYDAGATCRETRAARIALLSPAAADFRRTLDARNGKILDDLVLRKISFGAANRQWANAELDFNRLYAAVLAQRT